MPFVEPDPQREQEAREAMTQPPFTLSHPEREIVRDAFVALARKRGWHLIAAHVRSTHAHVIVQADRDPNRTMSDFKAKASFDLTRAGFDDSTRHRWTRHGSTPELYTQDQILATIRYVLDEQGERMAWYLDPEWAILHGTAHNDFGAAHEGFAE